jgi:hypothetical protein
MIWTKYHIELALQEKADLQEADLQGANLQKANLQRADLQWANLQGVDLQGADLQGADLQGANLQWANLQGANLQWANLQGANLQGANLQWADLQEADLQWANLKWANLGANLQEAKLPDFQLVPEQGSFIAFKKLADDTIATIKIPTDAKRTSSLVGRKCRAEYVKVLKLSKGKKQFGIRDYNTVYEVGKITKADKWDDDIRLECTHGIHFFMTRKEAEEFSI